MALVDRMVFGNSQTDVWLVLQAAGVCQIFDYGPQALPGIKALSYIGTPFGDGVAYVYLSMESTEIDTAAVDAALASNIDPTRPPLRVSILPVSGDPDATARRQYQMEQRTWRERMFQRIKDRMGVERVARMQLRHAAYNAGQLTALDNAVAASSDAAFKVRWEEHDDFSRANLNALKPSLTDNQIDTLFNNAKALWPLPAGQ